MRCFVLIACAGLLLFVSAQAAFAGLGKPLPGRAPQELKELKSSPAYKQALKALEAKGYSREQADAALAKLPAGQLSLLGSQAREARAGGDLIGLLFFVLFVVLIVYLIMLVVDSASYRRY